LQTINNLNAYILLNIHTFNIIEISNMLNLI